MSKTFFYRIGIEQPLEGQARDSIGGRPILHSSQAWPTCKECGEKLLFLMQFDIRAEYETPFEADSHFLVFACWKHDDIANTYPDSSEGRLPVEFWKHTYGYYQLILNRPSDSEVVLELESRVTARTLTFTKERESLEDDGEGYQEGSPEAKVEGQPHWLQWEEKHTCACGAPMRYFCQLPASFEFPKPLEAPEQPNGIGNDCYLLFLGNTNFFMACETQCSPYAVISAMQ